MERETAAVFFAPPLSTTTLHAANVGLM